MPRIPILKLGSSVEPPPPRLATYWPALCLEGLQLGIDNVRHDVWLSPSFCKAAGSHIAHLIAKYGNVESVMSADASGSSGGKIVIAAIDCKGVVQVITSAAPTLEGGLAVAPRGFGAFGGDLMAPDELSGRIFAIAPDGKVTVVAQPPLAAGGDIGVEGVGFVPPGFMTALGGAVYFADRMTPGSPHLGSDSVLRLSSADLAAAGVQDGDMLVATEGGATMVAVRCAASCTVIPVVATPTAAHGEGHLVFTVTAPASAAPSPSPRVATPQPSGANKRSNPGFTIVAVVLVISAAALLLLRRRRG